MIFGIILYIKILSILFLIYAILIPIYIIYIIYKTNKMLYKKWIDFLKILNNVQYYNNYEIKIFNNIS